MCFLSIFLSLRIPSKIIVFFVLLISFLLSANSSDALNTQQPNSALKDMIMRVVSEKDFRNSLEIQNTLLLEEFYSKNEYALQWFSSANDHNKRNKLIKIISEPGRYMLEKADYQFSLIQAAKKISTGKDSLIAEIKFTDVSVSFLKDIAFAIAPSIKYNGLRYNPDCINVLPTLQSAIITGDFEKCIKETEPGINQYQKIKYEYQLLYNQFTKNDFREIYVDNKTATLKNIQLLNKLKQLGYMSKNDSTELQLTVALNKLQVAHHLPANKIISSSCLKVLNETIKEKLAELRWNVRWYKWLHCIQNNSFLLVNIASNRLTFIKNNMPVLESKIVVGKVSTPSPTLTSTIMNVIYYPYWNVPFSIAVKEMLPKLKRNSRYLDALKIDVLRGNYTYPTSSAINWRKYSSRNFPFNFRQRPGCHNSLGLLKFDFENPFHVYLHDTNNKSGFLSGKRFYSHGCIRVEKPYELAMAMGIDPDQINMDSCLSEMKPQIIPVNIPVPVFVIYATADVINGELCWFEDAYHKREK